MLKTSFNVIGVNAVVINAVVITFVAASTLLGSIHAPQTAQAITSVHEPPATHTHNTAATVYAAYAKPATRMLATPAAGPMLPIEVLTGDNPANTTLFPNGFTKAVTVTVANAANAKKFWMQVYSLSYQDKAASRSTIRPG